MKGSKVINILSRREGKKLDVYIRVNNILYNIDQIVRHAHYDEGKRALNVITIDAGCIASAVSDRLAVRSERP